MYFRLLGPAELNNDIFRPKRRPGQGVSAVKCLNKPGIFARRSGAIFGNGLPLSNGLRISQRRDGCFANSRTSVSLNRGQQGCGGLRLPD
jgi:hypothetical protein